MGQRGPLPKPTQRKRLEGNPGNRPLPDDEPEPALLAAIPKPPEWFPPLACDAYWVVCRELQSAEMLAALDLPIVEQYCMSYAQWRAMIEGVKVHGYTVRYFDDSGNVRYAQATPEATLCRQFAIDCNRWAKVLGLGPAYRVGLRLGSDPNDESDPIAGALDGKKGNGGVDHNPPPKRRKSSKKRAAKKATKKRTTKKRSAKKSRKSSTS
jgi:P27 family predicted phage terminase small subunit